MPNTKAGNTQIWAQARAQAKRKTPIERPITSRTVGEARRASECGHGYVECKTCRPWMFDEPKRVGSTDIVFGVAAKSTVGPFFARSALIDTWPDNKPLSEDVDYGQLPDGVACDLCETVHRPPACEVTCANCGTKPSLTWLIPLRSDGVHRCFRCEHQRVDPGDGYAMRKREQYARVAAEFDQRPIEEQQTEAGAMTRQQIYDYAESVKQNGARPEASGVELPWSAFNVALQCSIDQALARQRSVEAATGVKHVWHPDPNRVYDMVLVPADKHRQLTAEELAR